MLNGNKNALKKYRTNKIIVPQIYQQHKVKYLIPCEFSFDNLYTNFPSFNVLQ